MEGINKIKVTLTALFTGFSVALGWFGWLIVLFALCLALDFITGSASAGKRGEWNSTAAREGLWHKLGSIVAVLVAAIADGLLGIILGNLPGIALPFEYTVMLCPVVLVWYIFTELGSIIENAAKLGAPIPPFLSGIIAICKKQTEAAGGKFAEREKV